MSDKPWLDDLEGMTPEELSKALTYAEEHLEELIEDRTMTLGQTGVHMGMRELKRIRRTFERDEERLQERMSVIRTRLAE